MAEVFAYCPKGEMKLHEIDHGCQWSIFERDSAGGCMVVFEPSSIRAKAHLQQFEHLVMLPHKHSHSTLKEHHVKALSAHGPFTTTHTMHDVLTKVFDPQKHSVLWDPES